MLKNHKRSFILNFLTNEGLLSSSSPFKHKFDKPITRGERKKLKLAGTGKIYLRREGNVEYWSPVRRLLRMPLKEFIQAAPKQKLVLFWRVRNLFKLFNRSRVPMVGSWLMYPSIVLSKIFSAQHSISGSLKKIKMLFRLLFLRTSKIKKKRLFFFILLTNSLEKISHFSVFI